MPVVRAAHQADVLRILPPAAGVRIPMVILEPVTLRAAAPLLVHEAAPASVALVHDTPNRGRDVP